MTVPDRCHEDSDRWNTTKVVTTENLVLLLNRRLYLISICVYGTMYICTGVQVPGVVHLVLGMPNKYMQNRLI